MPLRQSKGKGHFCFLCYSVRVKQKNSTTILVFFPTRIIVAELNGRDHNEILDVATQEYLDEGLAILDEEGLKDAQKVIHFAKQFPDLEYSEEADTID